MASLNKVTLIANLCKDPEVKFTAAGMAVANISVATNEKWKNKNGDWEERAEFHNVVFFNKLAEIVGEYLVKGKPIYIEGSLRTEKYQDKDGNDRWTTKIIGDKMLMLGSKGEGERSAPQNKQQEEAPPFDDSDIPF